MAQPNRVGGANKPSYNPANYETVNDRIRRFYTDHEDARIVADIISDKGDLGTVICKAAVYLNADDQRANLPRGTGIASETFGVGSFANNGSHIENCETSAIGRALANAGYSGKMERASREEMEKVQRLQDQAHFAAVPGRTAPGGASGANTPTPREQRAQNARNAREAESPADLVDPPPGPVPAADLLPAEEAPQNARLTCNQCGKALTQGQYTMSLANFGIPLCPVHQQEAKRNVAAGE